MEKEPAHGASKTEVAAYVADLTGDLARIARQHRLDLLGYLLEVARLEAKNIADPEERRDPAIN
jgi:hypothetical protein